MKKTISAITLIMCSLFLKAQILTPVSWSFAAKRISKTEGVVFIKATIDESWHIYSQYIKEDGPVKTSFTFAPSINYVIIGPTIEPKPITKFEKVFNIDVRYFEHSVIFRQKIRLKTLQTVIEGNLEYMTCNEKQCLPPNNVQFKIPIK